MLESEDTGDPAIAEYVVPLTHGPHQPNEERCGNVEGEIAYQTDRGRGHRVPGEASLIREETYV